MTTRPILEFLAGDHARLDSLLATATAEGERIDLAAFGAFRAGLLRHIALEEKILIPAATAALGGEPPQLARRLRIEHGALAALLVPTPTSAIAGELRKILVPHNEAEEGPGGLYETCDSLLSGETADALLERMHSYPAVKVARYQDGPRVCRTAEEALRVSSLQADRRPRGK